MRILSFIRKAAPAAAVTLFLAGCGEKPTESNSQANLSGGPPLDYSSRIGVGVRTNLRTCISIKNRTLQANAFITLVQPASPQSFAEAQVSGPSPNPCPISEQVIPGMSSYEIALPASAAIPKQSPLIGVVGSAGGEGFALDNINVQADLDSDHGKNTFRACAANDGVHLSAWRGNPVIGTRLWTGYFYQAENPGTFPNCEARELEIVVPDSR